MIELSPELVLKAYACGVFPMAEHRNDPEIFWVDPRHRGIIPLDGFHLSRSLARTLRQDRVSVSVNRAFADVMEGCAEREETWINDQIVDLYRDLHASSHAHSLEIWDGSELVGGDSRSCPSA